MTELLDAAIAALAERGVTSLPPLGFVLGSGLGGLADEVEDAIAIPYREIPGFPVPSVAGHSGRLVVGRLEGRRVALFQGRGHYYERGDARAMFVAIETFKRLGGRVLFLTNAAGGLHTDWRPPSLAAIVDHINFAGANPLIGIPTDERFVPLTEAYDRDLLATLKGAARRADIDLHEGVYMWFSGPSLRDAGRNPRGENARRRSRRHVDGSRSADRALSRPALRRRLAGDQFRRRPFGRRSEPQGDAGRRRNSARNNSAVFSVLSSRLETNRLGNAHDAAAGNHSRQARRPGAERRRDRRLHRGPDSRDGQRRAGRRLRDGGVSFAA